MALENGTAHVEASVQHFDYTSTGFVKVNFRPSRTLLLSSRKPMLTKLLQLYVKADRGVAILEKKDCYEQIDDLVNNGPYSKLTKNPLAKHVTHVTCVRRDST